MRLLVALVCLSAGLGAVLGSVAPARSATRQVVMLFDERPELPGLAALDAEFVRALNAGSADRIEIYREELDRSRFDGTYVALQRDFLRAKYANKKSMRSSRSSGPPSTSCSTTAARFSRASLSSSAGSTGRSSRTVGSPLTSAAYW